MLEIIEYNKDEYTFPSLLVLGCFDAIHAGHRELFKKAKLQAKINGLDLGVMMFKDGKGGKQIYSFAERLKLIEGYNVRFVLAVDFTPEFMETQPLDFLQAVEDKINVKAYISGKDFRFGKGAKGKSATLKKYAEDEENGVWYLPVKELAADGEKISTTGVKACLDGGDVIKANGLLGESFFLEGEVVHGAGRGGDVLGYPTANIEYPEWKYPLKHGVYKVKTDIDGTKYFGIANFGTCPTFDDGRVILEVHYIGYEGDLYGKTLKIEFLGFMREVVRFESAQALAEQIAADKASLGIADVENSAQREAEEATVPEAPAVESSDVELQEKEAQ